MRRVAAAWGAPGLWAVADQCIVSAGNFVVAIAVARHVSPADLGAFGVLLGVILTANAIHASLVGVPLMVLNGPGRRSHDDVPAVALMVTGLSLLAYASALVVAVLVAGRPALLLPAVFALVAGQGQETLRRALMGRMEFRRAAWGDAVSYGGQALAVVAMALTGHLSLPNAFLAMGASSLAGAFVQWGQVRPRISGATLAGESVAPFWRLGKALVVVNGIGAVTVYGVPWLVGILQDFGTVGELQALLTVVSVANPLMMAANSVVTTKVAHAASGAGPGESGRTDLEIAHRYGVLTGAPLAAYWCVLLLVPGPVLSLFLGSDSPYRGLSVDLRLMVLYSAGMYAYFVLSGLLAGRQDTRSMLRAQLGALAALVLVGVPLVAAAGARGAVVAAGVTSLVRAVVANAGARGGRRAQRGGS